MEIKEEAARIRPAGPNLAHNRSEREEECTTQFFRKFRTKHANTNINELYTVEDWNDRRSTYNNRRDGVISRSIKIL